MQCCLREHLCFSPNVPLPGGEYTTGDGESSGIWSLDPHQLIETAVRQRFLR